MLFGHILTLSHFLVTLDFQAVRYEISRPETFTNNFPTTYLEKSRIFRVGQWGDFSKYRGFEAGGEGAL